MDQRTKNNGRRNLDKESGKQRVSNFRPKKSQPPPSESENEYVDSDLEHELEMPAKDDTVRPKKSHPRAQKPPRIASHGVSGLEEDGQDLAEEKARETNSKIAPHMLILLSATYHLGFSSITRPAISNYYPSCANLFQMAMSMMDLVSGNTYLQEMCPGFFSVSFYCYCGYLYYYQILRAKDEVGQNQLSRVERRVLRALKSIGEPESWPVPSPLIEFIRALGYYKSSNPQYSYVVPSFPDLSEVSRTGQEQGTGIARYNLVAGIQRLPPVCCYIEFLRKFGNATSNYINNQGWIPATHATLAAGVTYMGLANSGAQALPFRALVFSDGWVSPTEGDMLSGPIQHTTKRQVIRRWNCPDLSVQNINGLEMFTGLSDTISSSWIKHLIVQAKAITRFFPGSTTLAAIDPICHIGTLTDINVTRAAARDLGADIWYCPRQGYTTTYIGYDDTEQGRLLTRTGIATGTNVTVTNLIIPVGNLATGRNGPFFNDDADHPQTERHERFTTEGSSAQDVTARFTEQLTEIFDPTGKTKV